MEHNLDSNGTTPYLSDFGTAPTTRDEVIQYMISRAAIFFGDIAGGVAGSLGKKIFIECKNNRINVILLMILIALAVVLV